MRKTYLLLFSLSLFLIGCEKDAIIMEEEIIAKKGTLAYKTPQKEEVLEFLNSGETPKKSSFVTNIKLAELQLEPLVNSDQLIAVIPATTKYKHTNSSLLLMEVQNDIEAVAFIMHGNEEDETKNFTGEVMVTDLTGNFIIGYRVKEGVLTHTVFDNNNSIKSGIKCETDNSCGFHMSQGDVVVTGSSSHSNSIPYVSITHIYPNNYGGGGNDAYYVPGGGGGTVSSTNNDSELNNFTSKNVWNEQDPYDDWNRLTECEKDFFISNPHHLYNARANRIAAQNAARKRFGDCENPNGNALHNTIGDAYRHAYFAALNTQNMGYSNAKALGDAHECDTDEDAIDEKEMDLNNNDWGYLYGDTMSYIDENQFHSSFMDAFENGQIQILQECQ